MFKGVLRELDARPIPGKIVAIVGPRRAGKTFYMHYLLSHRYPGAMYLNFENVFLRGLKPREFFEAVEIYTEVSGTRPDTLLLDEVQEADMWEALLRTLLDYGYRIFVTGSSSKLLSRELATQLRGRVVSYLLLPFSFREFLRARGYDPPRHPTFEERGYLLRLLDEYLDIGGYPEVVLASDGFTREKILRTYYDEILLRDFIERHRLRSFELARLLFEFIFQNYSNLLSIKKIVNYIGQRTGLSKKTVYSYLDALGDTLSVFFLDRYSPSVYQRRMWPKKVYIADLGLAKPLQIERDIGKKMENTVYLELLRRTNREPLLQIYHYRDNRGREVDFILREGTRTKELIQVTYANSPDEIQRRELDNLVKIGEHLQCKNLRVITWNLETTTQHKNQTIQHTPLWKWLTQVIQQ